MSEDPKPEARGISPWWLLLLLLLIPVAGLIGWGIGQLPTPAAPTRPTAVAPPTSDGMTPAPEPSAAPPPAPASETPALAGEAESAPAPEPRRDEPSTEISRWTSLESAIAESRRNGKPVMIDFNAEWCGPCQRMKQQVFDDPVHGLAIETTVIPVSIVDRRREEGRNSPQVEHLQQQFQIDAFPTLVVLSPASGRFLKTRGYPGPEATVDWIKQAASSVR